MGMYRCLHTMQAKDQAPVVALSFVSSRAAVSGTTRGGLQLWNLDDGTCQHSLVGHRGRIRALHVVDSSRVLVSLDEQRHLRVWDLEDLRCRVHIDRSDHDGIFDVLGVDDGGTLAFSISDGGHGCLWDLTTGGIRQQLGLMLPAAPTRVELENGHGQTVHVELEDGSWMALDLASGTCSPAPPPVALRQRNGHPTYRPAVVEDRVVLQHVDDGRLVLVLEGHDEPVLCAAIAPDARAALSGDAGGIIRLFRLDLSDQHGD